MGVLDCACSASVWKGYYYYKDKKVLSLAEIEPNVFTAEVAGSTEQPYSVVLNLPHPRKSKCNCPHANGKRIMCKHIVAAYFTQFPLEAEKLYADAMVYQAEEEERQEELIDRVIQYVYKMKKSELQETLLDLLFTGSERQFAWFVDSIGLELE